MNGVGHRKDEGGSSGNIWGTDTDPTEFGWYVEEINSMRWELGWRGAGGG
jgi:hypothetical protein